MQIAPPDMDSVFFANSGSEAVDTALKIAIAWHRARGEGQRTRLIGRERGYHGVGFGGTSVGGIKNNRKAFGMLLPGVDHLPHTLDLAGNAFSRGEPDHGIHLADQLEWIVDLHDASTSRPSSSSRSPAPSASIRRRRLSEASARNLRPARHPAHLRRG